MTNASRFADRHEDSEALLNRGIAVCGPDTQLRRLLALARFSLGRTADAIAVLAEDSDPENLLLRAELVANTGDAKSALEIIQSIDTKSLPDRVRRLQLNVLADLSLTLSDWRLLESVVQQYRERDPNSLAAELLLLRQLRRKTNDRNAVREMAKALVKRVGEDADFVTRFEIAAEALRIDLPNEAILLLRDHVDLQRASPPTFLYLESLATSRRDKTFLAEVSRASEEVRNDSRLEWIVAIHAWNLGDLEGCLATLKRLFSLVRRHIDAAGSTLVLRDLRRA